MSTDQETSDLVGQRNQRLEKIKKLRELGIDPYPAKSFRTHDNSEIVEDFDKLNDQEVTVAGRVKNLRTHGHIVFVDIEDQSGTVQLYIKSDALNASKDNQTLNFENLNLVDNGDYIEAKGTVTKTQSGEISVMPNEIRLLVKTLRPLPVSIEDKEERFRRRYVDMKINPEVRKLMERRALFWQAHREFFNERGFFEVNIPVLELIPGGGDAVPFMTHMNAINEDFYLRISHELPLKRLTGAGFDKVYDIGARFRNEGISDEHLPEHVAMEFYWAYADYEQGMEFVQEMFNYIIERVYGEKKVFKIRDFEVDFSNKEWERIDFGEVFKEHFGVKDVYNIKLDEVRRLLDENEIEYEKSSINVPRGVDMLWKKIRKTIAGPAFLINHPKYLSPLQKPSVKNPLVVERIQPIIAGSELGNGWSEVNDPIDQYERFVEQQNMRDAGDEEAQWLDIDYVEMLEYGMPPTFGWGHSERVFWFLEDVTAREGVPFPQMKFHISEKTKEIYPEIDFESIRDFADEDAAALPLLGEVTPTKSESMGSGTEAKDSSRGQDFNNRIVIVLNKELEGWQLTNTIAHISAKLGAEIGDEQLRTRDTFETENGSIKANSQYPIVTMKAKPGQMYNLLQKIEELGLPNLAYTQEMIDFGADDELQDAYSGKKKEELNYLGIGFFGDNETLKKLTNKFSLWG